MRKLLAVGVVGDWIGDWHRCQGNERAAVASPISDGEKIWLEVEAVGREAFLAIPLTSTPTILTQTEKWLRYRVVKRCDVVAEPARTTVELISNGAALSENRHAINS